MLCRGCRAFCAEIATQIVLTEAKGPEDQPHDDFRWAYHSAILHDSIIRLKEASSQCCPICRAVLSTPTVYERSLLRDDCMTILEFNPRDANHPVISTRFEDQYGTVLVPNRTVAMYAGRLSDDELMSTLRKCARLDNESTGSDAMFELSSFWLNRCLSTHVACPKPTSSTFFMPTRLLDVSNYKDLEMIRLVETSALPNYEYDGRYVALSHCWGSKQIITTDDNTYPERLQAIPIESLSQTFRDAVTVVARLGIRYLWIDSLCIIQKNSKDWEKEASQMCRIYREAVFTIAAAHAPSGDVGCFKERDGILQLPFELDFPVTTTKGTTHLRALFNTYGRRPGLDEPEPPLYGRAWVLQEQILSPRMLIFDGSQLRWECLCMHGSETSPSGGMSRHIGHQKTIRNGIMEDMEFFTLDGFDDDFASRHQNSQWCYAVMDFTHRGMTKPSDRLIAISGIADAIKLRTKNEYVAGLWRDQLWLGLLWYIPHTAEYTPTTMHAFNMEQNDKIRHENLIAPSWSWASVTAPVVFPVPAIGTIFIQRMCEILDVRVSGSPARQEGTLKIRGATRTVYINSVYQYGIREACTSYPSMAFRKPDGAKRSITYRSRAFHPNDFFLVSLKAPNARTHWHLVRGCWRPDEVLDPKTPITFVAIAQQTRMDRSHTRRHGDPLEVFALGLVPTGRAPDEYRRVGCARWDDCAWYGYDCADYENPDRSTEPAAGWNGAFWRSAVRVRQMLRDPEVSEICKIGRSVHEHPISDEALRSEAAYYESLDVKTKLVAIV